MLRSSPSLVALVHFPKFIQLIFIPHPHLRLLSLFIIRLVAQSRKAGGLTVTETLACGLPIILINVIPGQETGNADYVVNGNAGDLARDPMEVLEVMCHWLEKEGELYNVRSLNARSLGRPRAAYDIAELVWAAANVTDQ